jgi:hypothetical protein
MRWSVRRQANSSLPSFRRTKKSNRLNPIGF